jgi:DNA polymerase III subunit epsilon
MPSLRVAYADTETTGLSPNFDRIIEIAIVLAEVDWETGAIIQRLDQYQGLQDPGCRIPADAMAVHGITDAMVRGQHIDCRRAKELLVEADICLAHNSGFDKGFVAQVVPEARSYTWGCTCRGIPWKVLYPSLRSTALQSLSSYFSCEKGAAHRALGDVETTMNLVSLPGIHGARAFQHYILHKKIRRKGLTPEIVVMPDLMFQRQVFG